MIYGVHGNSGYLFRFDPRVPRIEVLDRITSEPSKRCGMFDQFSYGYLGFALGPDGKTIHYLTGGPIYIDGKRLAGKSKTAMGEAKGLEDLHLVTYNIETGKYTRQRGRLLRERPAPALCQCHRRGQGRHGLYAAAHHRERQDPLRPGRLPRSAQEVSGRAGLGSAPVHGIFPASARELPAAHAGSVGYVWTEYGPAGAHEA